MRNTISVAAALLLAASSHLSAASEHEIRFNFDGESNSYSNPIPGVDATGTVSGTLITDISEELYQFEPKKLKLNFEKMPTLTIQDFKKEDEYTYTATVNNSWIFRGLNVRLYSSDGFSHPDSVYVDFSIKTGEGYTDNSDNPPSYQYDIAHAELFPKAVEKFSPIDTIKTKASNKNVVLKLNNKMTYYKDRWSDNLSLGMEVKVTWFGHGEGTFYMPVDIQNSRPVAMFSQFEPGPNGGLEEIIHLRYKQDGETVDIGGIRLEDILNEAMGYIEDPFMLKAQN